MFDGDQDYGWGDLFVVFRFGQVVCYMCEFLGYVLYYFGYLD